VGFNVAAAVEKQKRKQLGADLVNLARDETPAKSLEQESERVLFKEWGEYLGGVETIKEEQEILDRYRDPEDLAKALEEWRTSDLGFACENMKIRSPEGELLPAETALDPYQVAMLERDAQFGVMMKARRIGGSVGSEVKSVAAICRAINPSSSHFISQNHREATDKVVDSYSLYETIPKRAKPPKIGSGIKAQLEFKRKDGRIVRIVSRPQTEPRAIEGYLWLDEFGGYDDQPGIYSAAIPATSLTGFLWIIGTPGASYDLFSDIMENRNGPNGQGYPAFNGNRYKIMWWECVRMVQSGKFEEAQEMCPQLSTKDRVERYGAPRLQNIWQSAPSLAWFQREEECVYVDDAESYYPDHKVRPCIVRAPVDGFSNTIDWGDEKPKLTAIEERLRENRIDDTIFGNVSQLATAIAYGRVGKSLVMGVDPGFKDGCAITIIEECPGNLAFVRYQEKFEQHSFPEIENKLVNIAAQIPVRQTGIDAQDPEGRALMDRLRGNPRFGSSRITPVPGSAFLNAEMAVDLMERFEAIAIAIPEDTELIRDIKKVRRAVKQGLVSIDVKRDEHGHGDRFFSLIYALACMPRLSRCAPLSVRTSEQLDELGVPRRIVPATNTRPVRPDTRSALITASPTKRMVPKMPRASDLSHLEIGRRLDPFSLPKKWGW